MAPVGFRLAASRVVIVNLVNAEHRKTFLPRRSLRAISRFFAGVRCEIFLVSSPCVDRVYIWVHYRRAQLPAGARAAADDRRVCGQVAESELGGGEVRVRGARRRGRLALGASQGPPAPQQLRCRARAAAAAGAVGVGSGGAVRRGSIVREGGEGCGDLGRTGQEQSKPHDHDPCPLRKRKADEWVLISVPLCTREPRLHRRGVGAPEQRHLRFGGLGGSDSRHDVCRLQVAHAGLQLFERRVLAVRHLVDAE